MAVARGDGRLALVILAVRDVETAARFYAEVFGWPREVDVGVYVEFAIPGGANLGVYRRESFALNTNVLPAPVPAGAVSATEVYLRVDDLDGAISRLESAGGRLLSARAARDWGDEAAYYADPDGNVVVVARRPSP